MDGFYKVGMKRPWDEIDEDFTDEEDISEEEEEYWADNEGDMSEDRSLADDEEDMSEVDDESEVLERPKKRRKVEPKYKKYKPQIWDVYNEISEQIRNKYCKLESLNMEGQEVLYQYMRICKAPYIRGKKGRYKDYLDALKEMNADEFKIIEALLEMDFDFFSSSPGSADVAARFLSTVYLAEEWRKQGAQKIFRAYLRYCKKHPNSFFDLNKLKEKFRFASTAQEGRLQVAMIYAYCKGELNKEDLRIADQEIVSELSDMEQGDYSTDEEKEPEKELQKKRKYDKDEIKKLLLIEKNLGTPTLRRLMNVPEYKFKQELERLFEMAKGEMPS